MRGIQNNKGFSLIEVIVAASIAAVLASITFVTFTTIYKTHALDKTRSTAISILELARANSMASKGSSHYGVHFATTTITLFQGTSYSGTAASNQVFSLSPYVQLSTTTLNGGGKDIVFGRLTGTTTHYGTITYKLSTDASTTKTITIHTTGIIE